jgi:peptidoglycan LD-endopeptidase LytH
MNTENFLLSAQRLDIYPMIDYNRQSDKISVLDLSASNKNFHAGIFNDMEKFNSWIEEQQQATGAKYLVGGYKENRQMYSRSELFGTPDASEEEPRSFHLGIDVWGKAGTAVYAPLDGIVHSFAFNNNFGDYGATIILLHRVNAVDLYVLYGHLALTDLTDLQNGMKIEKGSLFAHFGTPEENGHWPPHLHLQAIFDMNGWEGDYPGVCKPSESGSYIVNSPDPSFLLPF